MLEVLGLILSTAKSENQKLVQNNFLHTVFRLCYLKNINKYNKSLSYQLNETTYNLLTIIINHFELDVFLSLK